MSMLTPRTPVTWANFRWAYGRLFYGTRADYWLSLLLPPLPHGRFWQHCQDLRQDVRNGTLTTVR